MPKKAYQVVLTLAERARLHTLVTTGSTTAHGAIHARILLKADTGPDGPGWTDAMIATALDVGVSTVARVRQTAVQQGLDAALQRKAPTRTYARTLDGVGEAHLIALACSATPEGADRWSLRLLADRMVELGYVETISHETVRQTLKKTTSSRGGSRSGAFRRKPTPHL
jgi:Homeodomain-like domain